MLSRRDIRTIAEEIVKLQRVDENTISNIRFDKFVGYYGEAFIYREDTPLFFKILNRYYEPMHDKKVWRYEDIPKNDIVVYQDDFIEIYISREDVNDRLAIEVLPIPEEDEDKEKVRKDLKRIRLAVKMFDRDFKNVIKWR